MINVSQIKPNVPVVCSNNMHFATVDRMEDATAIKLNKDDNGAHHYIPLNWVKSVDDKIHLDRPWEQIEREWTTTPVAPHRF